ncbi:MAG: hypothetical protein OXC41_00215 [Gammaproteobacteria bacterium]|nr:hypothetical protein [Gammaproteobacteria bacterium]
MSCLRSFFHSRTAFIAGSLLWLPAGIVFTSLLRNPGFPQGPEPWPMMVLMMILQLAVIAPCGLALTLACRLLWRRGYRRAAWTAMAVLAPVTAWASLFAGLLGPIAIAIYATVLSLPVWLAASILRRQQ